MATTSIQKEEAIRQGSVRVLLGDDFNSLVDIGAMRSPELSSLAQNQEIEFDNVDDLRKFVDGKRIQFSFKLAEINLTHLEKLESGLVNLSTVDGSLVSGATQTVYAGDWDYKSFIQIENQNGDGSAITVNSVSGATDGTLTEDTDYYVGQDDDGDYGIFIIDSTAVTTTDQNLTIDYDYTPAASKKITFNDSGTKNEDAVIRLINVDENGNEFKVDIDKVTNMASTSITFAADTDEDVAIMPMELHGEIVEIVDEQQTS